VMENVSSISDSLAKSDILSLVNNLNEITNNIARGKGSLAKLINDDNFYDNLEKSSKEMNLLIEDIKNNPSRYVNFSILGGSKKSYQKK
jgi:phospholipid/cholesterol/gamma-HCH transport system substrate-binding protein